MAAPDTNFVNLLKRDREITEKLVDAKETIYRLSKRVAQLYKENVNYRENQSKFPPVMNISNEIDASVKEYKRVEELTRTAASSMDDQVLENVRVEISNLKRSIGGIENRFVRLYQTYRLGYVTISQQHVIDVKDDKGKCKFCWGNLNIGTTVRECPGCRQFFHENCVSNRIIEKRKRTCPDCSIFIHL